MSVAGYPWRLFYWLYLREAGRRPESQLFAVYDNDLIVQLRSSRIGCYVMGLFLACLFFADDLCLISPTRSVMQNLLDMCNDYCSKFNLTFNASKSKTLIFGKAPGPYIKPLMINGCDVDIVSEWKYLGTTVISNKTLSFSAKNELRSFYASFNSLSSPKIRLNEVTLMALLYATCVPIITYASEVKFFSASEMQMCHTAVNNAIRRISQMGKHSWSATAMWL